MDGPNWYWRAFGAGAVIAAFFVWLTFDPKAVTGWQFLLAGVASSFCTKKTTESRSMLAAARTRARG
jgi:hypothetical protein